MQSSRLSAKLARVTKHFLSHTCTVVTYIPQLDDEDEVVTNEDGHTVYEEVLTNNVICLFLWNEKTTTNEQGTVTTKTPTIYFENNSTIQVGDLVRNVRAKDTSLLITSAKINTVDSTAEGGNASLVVCELEGATI